MKIIRTPHNVIFLSDNDVSHEISFPYSHEDFTDDDLLEYLAGDVYFYTSVSPFTLEETFNTWMDASDSEAYAHQIRLSQGFYLDCTQSERDHMDYLISDLDNDDGAQL